MSLESFTNGLSSVLTQGGDLDALDLETLLDAIPSVDRLQALPEGTPVLLRLDLDVPVKAGVIADDSRLVSSLDTVNHCRQRGWKTIILGHMGRDGTESLGLVRDALAKLIGCPVHFFADWIEGTQSNPRVAATLIQDVHAAAPGSVFLLENTRKYPFETVLWKKSPPLDRNLVEPLFALADDIRRNLSRIEINDAIAASNLDFSSSALPLVMDINAVGFFLSSEFRTHVRAARKADFLVFSGLKANKLDDLELVIDRGKLHAVLSAGAIAMGLRKAKARLEGSDFSIGRAETDASLKSFISEARIKQGMRIVEKCREKHIQLVLPIDCVLDNGEVSAVIPKDAVQFDIGPNTRALFDQTTRDYAQAAADGKVAGALYYNGVFGRFEDDAYAAGTRSFIQSLGTLTQAGVKTYVGGGEGRLALLKYGSLADVTHAFTCGGTILKSLTNHHIGFLKAMYVANQGAKTL